MIDLAEEVILLKRVSVEMGLGSPTDPVRVWGSKSIWTTLM